METLIVISIVVGAALYFVPALIAMGRRNAGYIFLLNLLFGWTVLGWIICFVWACTSPREDSAAVNLDSTVPATIPSGLTEITVRGEDQNNLDGTSRQRIIAQLSVGAAVTLVREPNNLADRNAIRVDSEHGCIGYVAREEAARLAPIADVGRIGKVIIKDIIGGDAGRPSRGVWLAADIQSATRPASAPTPAWSADGQIFATLTVGIIVLVAIAYAAGLWK